MSGAIDVLNPERPKRILMLASSPAVSEQTGWPDRLLVGGAHAAARLVIEALGV
jgi:hypothetical protein